MLTVNKHNLEIHIHSIGSVFYDTKICCQHHSYIHQLTQLHCTIHKTKELNHLSLSNNLHFVFYINFIRCRARGEEKESGKNQGENIRSGEKKEKFRVIAINAMPYRVVPMA